MSDSEAPAPAEGDVGAAREAADPHRELRELARELGLSPDPTAPVRKSRPLSLTFDGKADDYFRIWIVNLSLTLLTLGIFSAWAKVRKKRFVYAHTRLDGTPFEYLGRPVPILKGRLIAAAAFLTWSIVSRRVPHATPWLLGLGAFALPWIVVRTASFNARVTAYRNLTFAFSPRYFDAVKMMLAGVVITAMSFGLGYGVWRHRLARFVVQGTSYGSTRAQFFGRSRPFLSAYLGGLAILVVTMIPAVFFMVRVGIFSGSALVKYGSFVPLYAAYATAFVYTQTRMRNAIWNQTQLGPLTFASTLRAREVLRLYVSNAVAIVASCELLVPWAEMRMFRYRASRFAIISHGSLAEFGSSEASAPSAVGAELADLFELDLSL
jgi:uncharacterized membrane protein YjgN (DUF898 family)